VIAADRGTPDMTLEHWPIARSGIVWPQGLVRDWTDQLNVHRRGELLQQITMPKQFLKPML